MQQLSHAHPITLLMNEYVKIFSDMGFDIADGPELETEWYNFSALNVPADHPSRDMQDTFWIDGDKEKLLRTQTSPVQIRELKKWDGLGNLAIICPGKVFRNEATDATHEAQFHQVEGLLVGENITMGDLKGVLDKFFKKLLGEDSKIRMRSSFFPFVEPGCEVDIQCFKCHGAGCNVCKQSGWIELLGAGMVHPKVIENCGHDSRLVRGFAFGFGLDRMAMMRFELNDIRYLYNGDLRVVSQF